MSDQVLIKMYVGIHEVPRAGTQKETQPPAESSLLGDEWTQTSSFCRPHIPTLAKAKEILLLDVDNEVCCRELSGSGSMRKPSREVC